MNIEHLKKQAKNLKVDFSRLATDAVDGAITLAQAQEAVARMHGFPSWHAVATRPTVQGEAGTEADAGRAEPTDNDWMTTAAAMLRPIAISCDVEWNPDVYLSALQQLAAALFDAYATLGKTVSVSDVLDDILFPYRLLDLLNELTAKHRRSSKLSNALSSFVVDGRIDEARYNVFGFRNKAVRALRAMYGSETTVLPDLNAIKPDAYALVRWRYPSIGGDEKAYDLHAWVVDAAPSMGGGHRVLILQAADSAFAPVASTLDTQPLLNHDLLRADAADAAIKAIRSTGHRAMVDSVAVAVNQQRDAKRHASMYALLYPADRLTQFSTRSQVPEESFSPIIGALHLGIGIDALGRFALRKAAGLESDEASSDLGNTRLPRRGELKSRLKEALSADSPDWLNSIAREYAGLR